MMDNTDNLREDAAMTRKTGYHVWIFGVRYWHWTEQGAVRRALAAERYASGHVQIIDVATGEQIGY